MTYDATLTMRIDSETLRRCRQRCKDDDVTLADFLRAIMGTWADGGTIIRQPAPVLKFPYDLYEAGNSELRRQREQA